MLVAALALVVAAVVAPGWRISDLHLHDAHVFVVKQSGKLVGGLNVPSKTLSNAAVVGSSQYQVLQEDGNTLVEAIDTHQLSSYDLGTNAMSAPVTIPQNAEVSLQHGVLMVTNPGNGRVWYGPVNQMMRTDFQIAKAQLGVGEGGRAILTASGEPLGLKLGARPQIIRPGHDPVDVPMALTQAGRGEVQLSAVGQTAVVLDRTSQQIWLEGDKEPLGISGGTSAQLLAPTDESLSGFKDVRAVFSSQAGLNGLDKRRVVSLSGLVNATPIQPIMQGGCIYAAFGDRFVKRCQNADPKIVPIPELPGTAEMHFETNRGQVVLNDAISGYIWLVDDGMQLIKDWSKVTPDQPKDDPAKNKHDDQNTPPDRTKPNRPPIANPDNMLKARAGASTSLYVLDNDSDPDGDVLKITQVSGGNDTAVLQPVQGGSGLQITLSPSTPIGSKISFSYTVDDGRGKSARTTGTVTVLSANQAEQNSRPELRHTGEKLTVGRLQQATRNVLQDWRDPDGDDLILVNAQLDGKDDEVSFTPDGKLTFQDVGKTTGTKQVELTVSDGSKQTETQKTTVEVVKNAAAPPVALADHYTASQDSETVLDPLTNDEGQNLSLGDVKVEDRSKASLVHTAITDNTIRFRASKPGTYYLSYNVSNGPVAVGLIRVDVLSADRVKNHAPVAARDVVLLPPGGSVLVDPLANDFDQDGDVMVITDVQAPKNLRTTLEQRHMLRVSAYSDLSGPEKITYTISDGQEFAVGTVMVLPITQTSSQAPKANPDNVRARAGTVQTFTPLDNDRSPVGLDLHLTKVSGANGRAWIEGDKVRVQTPAQAGTGEAGSISFSYEIADSDGRTASSTMNVSVVSTDAQNEPPIPQTVEARVIQGSTTRIVIPTRGIDPNGDEVKLLGLDQGPSQGRITEVGDGYLTFQAFPTSRGTDVFSYQVADPFGGMAVGQLKVGIAPPQSPNQAPTATDDELRVRPGSLVNLSPMDNDFDLDGDSIGLAGKDPVNADFPTRVINKQLVQFTAKKAADGTASVMTGKYYIEDSAGNTGDGTFSVTVDPSAPDVAPVAHDDAIQLDQIQGRDYVSADVLRNDFDPDGRQEDLQLSVPPGNDNATLDGRKLRVKVGAVRQQIRYQITDKEGAKADGVVTVPGRNDEVPRLKRHETLQVTAGDSTQINLNDYVQGTQGRTVTLTSTERVWTTNNAVVIPESQGLGYTAPVDYKGPAAVVFEVTDNTTADDKTARRAVVTLPIEVKPRKDQQNDANTDKLRAHPPHKIKDPVLEIGPDEGDRRIDLRSFFTDEDGDAFRFKDWKISGKSDPQVRARWDGEQLSLIYASASATAKPGTQITLTGRVVDTTESSDVVSVTVRVVKSTRPRPTATTDLVKDANAGQARSVDVLANDKSHLPHDDKLYLKSAQVISGSGTAKVDQGGRTVSVTPAKGFHGDMTVSYTIQDGTQDPERASTGKIVLTVRSTPDAPGVPREVRSGDGFVELTWTDGASNGLPITKRMVQVKPIDGGSTGKMPDCQTSTCTITGLQNAKHYKFTVTSMNQLGASPPSGESAVSMPDVIPERVERPTAKFGDGQLTISWPKGVSRGSPISKYRVVKVTGNGGAAQMEVGGNQTSVEYKGLTNGTDYQFTVQAYNAKGWSKDPSERSNPEHPTGPAAAPKDFKGADDAQANGGQVTLNWGEVNERDRVERWEIHTYLDGREVKDVIPVGQQGGTTHTISVNGLTDEREYEFRIYAFNRSNRASPAAVTKATPFGAPPRFTDVPITYDYPNGFTLTRAPDSGGRPVDSYIFRYYRGSNDWPEIPIKVGESIPLSRIENAHPGYGVTVGLFGVRHGKKNAASDRKVVETFVPPTVASLTYTDPDSNGVRKLQGRTTDNGMQDSWVEVHPTGNNNFQRADQVSLDPQLNEDQFFTYRGAGTRNGKTYYSPDGGTTRVPALVHRTMTKATVEISSRDHWLLCEIVNGVDGAPGPVHLIAREQVKKFARHGTDPSWSIKCRIDSTGPTITYSGQYPV